MWRLTTEEIALLLSFTGHPELGQVFLASESEALLSQTQIQERLISATHSLLAAQHAAVSADGRILLGSDLAVIAGALTHVPYSMRLTRSYRNVEINLTYHFAEQQIIAHWLEQGVVHCFEFIKDRLSVADAATEFLMSEVSVSDEGRSFSIEDAAFDGILMPANNREPEQQFGIAQASGSTTRMFASDTVAPRFRGSVLLVQYPSDSPPVANAGFLLLAGKTRLWLIEPNPSQKQVVLTTIGALLLREKIQTLLHTATVLEASQGVQGNAQLAT